MALGALELLTFRGEAPAGAITERPMKLKPTNHMRPSGGGAFPLPSDGWVSLQLLAHARARATARQSAKRPDAVHRCPPRSGTRANIPSERGVSVVPTCA